jgi:hypothetical protein
MKAIAVKAIRKVIFFGLMILNSDNCGRTVRSSTARQKCEFPPERREGK